MVLSWALRQIFSLTGSHDELNSPSTDTFGTAPAFPLKHRCGQRRPVAGICLVRESRPTGECFELPKFQRHTPEHGSATHPTWRYLGLRGGTAVGNAYQAHLLPGQSQIAGRGSDPGAAGNVAVIPGSQGRVRLKPRESSRR